MITPYHRLSGQIKQTGITLESWVQEKTVNVEAANKNQEKKYYDFFLFQKDKINLQVFIFLKVLSELLVPIK